MTPTDAMQRDFARLAGDATARTRFRQTAAVESAALAELDARPLDAYAGALLAKRFQEVRRLLPHSARAADFHERFVAYAERRPIGGLDRHRADAIAFARALATPIARAERLELQAHGDRAFFAVALADRSLLVWLRPYRGARLTTRAFRI